jgi:hypothetical protein
MHSRQRTERSAVGLFQRKLSDQLSEKTERSAVGSHQWFLATWAKRLTWREVAEAFHTTWDNVFRSLKRAVQWGLDHRDLDGLEAIGVDEVQWRKGHKYLTLVYQIDGHCQRLLWVGQDRTAKSFLRFFHLLGKGRSAVIKFVCSDMWPPYLKVIAKKAGQAVHVLDRYHIMAKMNKAIDEVRAAEVKRLKQQGQEPVLKHARWCLLKRPENLTDRQAVKLSELLKLNLKAVRAYLLREDFQRFWEYQSPWWAKRFLKQWCTRTMRSKIEPMKKVARMLRSHEGLILNWSGPRDDVIGSRGGPEQQSEIDDEEGVRVPHGPGGRTGVVSQPWEATRAEIDPQILLTSPQDQRRDGQRVGEPVRGADSHGGGDLSSAGDQRAGVPEPVLPGPSGWRTGSFAHSHRLGYSGSLIGD